MTPNQVIKTLFDLWEEYKQRHPAIELWSFKDFMFWLVEEEKV